MRLFISGYGGASGETAGVYCTEERRFIWKSGVPRISFICGDAALFFGAGEYDNGGEVYMFVPDGTDNWRLADTLRVPGGALCHIAYSPRHKILTGACYGSGDIFTVSITAHNTASNIPGAEFGQYNESRSGKTKYAFGTIKSYIKQGEEDTPPPEFTRAHCAVIDPRGKFIYSANIALDRIYKYEVIDGALTAGGYTQLEKGVGPRHIVVLDTALHGVTANASLPTAGVSGPAGTALLVITEYSNEIIVILNDNVVGRYSILPDGFTGKSYGSAICFLPTVFQQKSAGVNSQPISGFIYAANRGANTVAVFKCKFTDLENVEMKKIFDCPCGGNWPRHMELVRLFGKPHLAVANEKDGNVIMWEIDENTGQLKRPVFCVPFEGASFAGGGE
jgi:6-phosphogluconolactonase (cycloisomerase 2 family)